MNILGIETSCDETSVALLTERGEVRSNLIASQIERHQPFGGVVPEIASREHLQHMIPLVEKALSDAGATLADLDAIAVTSGPGLIGALLVGVAAAQGLSYGLRKPLVAVNHLEGHIFSPYLNLEGPATPMPRRFLSLVISGGHSSIYDVTRIEGVPRVEMMNRTRDDAAGEVFDKVARILGLPYPGGPQVERTAEGGDVDRYPFSLPQFKDESADFSFSGLKATAIRLAREEGLAGAAVASAPDAEQTRRLADFCASFQRAIGDQLLDRLSALWPSDPDAPSEIALAGGVAANGTLRTRIEAWGAERGITVRLPARRFCTDNAAMIAFAGLQKLAAGDATDPLRVQARSRMAVGTV